LSNKKSLDLTEAGVGFRSSKQAGREQKTTERYASAPVVRDSGQLEIKKDAVYGCTHITDNILLNFADM
jgi:hypothetical protein